jgi:pectate lyase
MTLTGGGTATPVVVSTYSALKAQLTSSSPAVVWVSGTIYIPHNGYIDINSNKSVYGLPGATLIDTNRNKGAGIFRMDGTSNIIVRNLIFAGPGALDADAKDNIQIINSAHHIWVDHCEIRDGIDGNLDITKMSNYITVSNCKFHYLIPPRACTAEEEAQFDGGCETIDHRLSNLVGADDSNIGDRGKLKITWQFNHWADGAKDRLPFVRFGHLHIVNNLYTSQTTAKCIQARKEANLYVEKNVFSNVKKPIECSSEMNAKISWKDNLCTGQSTTYTENYVNNLAGRIGSSWYPYDTTGYEIAVISANEVENYVLANAGAKLQVTGSSAANYQFICNNTALPAPENATYQREGNSLNINWTAVANAEGYNIKLCQTAEQQVVTGNELKYDFNTCTAADYTTATILENGITAFPGTKHIYINDLAEATIIDGGMINKCLKVSGGGSINDCYVKIHLYGAGTLTVYNNGKTVGDRVLRIAISDGTLLSNDVSNDIVSVNIPAEGDYYIFSKGSGIEIYLIKYVSNSGENIVNQYVTSCEEFEVGKIISTILQAGTDSVNLYIQALGNGADYLNSNWIPILNQLNNTNEIIISEKSSIIIYNCQNNILCISGSYEKYEIYDMNGRILQSGIFKENIEVALPKSLYIIKLFQKEKCNYFKFRI